MWAGSGPGFGATARMMVGILDDFDDFAIFLRQPDGETFYLPRSSIRELMPMAPPEDQPQGYLLRASSKPQDSESLVRPAANPGDSDPDKLLRPARSNKGAE